MFDDFSDDYGEGPYSGYDYSLPEDFSLSIGSLGNNADLGLNFDWGDLTKLVADPELFAAFAQLNPEDAAILKDLVGGDYGFAPVGGGSPADAASAGNYNPDHQSAAETARLQRQASLTASGQNAVANIGPQGDTGVPTQSADPTGLAALKKRIADALGVKEDTLGDMAKYATALGIAKLARDDAEKARKEARGASFKASAPVTATRTAYKGTKYSAAGGLASLAEGGKTSLPPRYLDGHTDGMADNVPAHIDRKRPAALSDGEFVIPADVVSHLGNGNSNAGAKRLYEMMDRIRSARTGNSKQGKQINPNRFLPR